MVAHRRRSRQICGSAMDFCPNFPQTCPKRFCAIFACKFCPTQTMKACFGMTSGKKSLPVFFYKHWAPFCEMKQRCAPFCSDFHGFCPTFQGFCPDFNKSTSLGVQLHPSTPASCTTVVTATFVESSVAKSSLALRGMCDLPRTGCVSRITSILKWHEQAFTE